MKKSNVIPLPRPKTFTTPEAFIERVRQEIFRDGDGYKSLAEKTGVATSTIGNLASGKTRWPRPTTLFPLLDVLDLEMRLVKKGKPHG
jgi:transcriptional regulator with XRE-family HTH domain